MKIVPSLLAAPRNFAEMKKQLAPLVAKKLISSVHVDVMDGEFVSNYTLDWLNVQLVAKLRSAFPKLFIEVHLMTQFPENYIDEFATAGTNRIWWHVEARKNGKKLAKMKRKWKKIKFGPAINPETSEEKLRKEKFSAVLVMTVHPGKGGQRFIKTTLKKIRKIRRKYPRAVISVDGGVDASNVVSIEASSVNEAVCGTSIFKGNTVKNVANLEKQKKTINLLKPQCFHH